MHKRFTDVCVWDKPWFRKLPPVEKTAWRYICDKCDNVGVWDGDTEVAEVFIGDKVDWNHLRESCNGNIVVLENGKWFLPDFVTFQYGELNEACRPHRSYLSLLEKHGLKGYSRVPDTLKDKDKDKELDKDKDKEPTDAAKVSAVVSYLNKQTGREFNAKTKATERLVLARVRDGHRFMDFKRVIDAKVKAWGADAKMADYLRPETLFGTKFDSYLAACEPVKMPTAPAGKRYDLAHYEATGELREL